MLVVERIECTLAHLINRCDWEAFLTFDQQSSLRGEIYAYHYKCERVTDLPTRLSSKPPDNSLRS